MKVRLLILPGLLLSVLSGCGYSAKALLPSHIKTISVAPFLNKIQTTGEVSEQQGFHIYRPGMEIKVTDAVTNRLLLDAGARIEPQGKSDAEISGQLIDYERQGLRFDAAFQIQEFRSVVTCRIKFQDLKKDKTFWDETFTGDSSAFSEGPRAQSEDQAITNAIEDLAIRVAQRVATGDW